MYERERERERERGAKTSQGANAIKPLHLQLE